MSALVPSDQIEAIVGADRHPMRHIGRAVSSERTVYILHSAMCLATQGDLRRCTYSRALDLGIDMTRWEEFQDQAVVLSLTRHSTEPGLMLVPDRPAPVRLRESDS